MAYHLGWWDIAIAHQLRAGASYCTITPEFGPNPYMPSLPYTRQPLADQWDLKCCHDGVTQNKILVRLYLSSCPSLTVRASAVADGDAFGKIEGIIEGD
jgi:hypothetical protein